MSWSNRAVSLLTVRPSLSNLRTTKLRGKPRPLTHCLLALTYLQLGEKAKAKAKDALAQTLPAKDASWEEVLLHRLFQPEIGATLAKADGKQDPEEK